MAVGKMSTNNLNKIGVDKSNDDVTYDLARLPAIEFRSPPSSINEKPLNFKQLKMKCRLAFCRLVTSFPVGGVV